MARLVAVVAALPREVKELAGSAKADASLTPKGIWLLQVPGAVIVAAGMGAARVSLAFQAALQASDLAEVLSVGLAGACRSDILPGTVVEAGRVVDVFTGERFSTASAESQHTLASTDRIASVAEKARLQAAYGASVVDMEAATVARLARAHGIPFRAIKGISDGHDFELASLSRFTDRQGQFRTAAFALYTALHPGSWRPAMTLGQNSTRALGALTRRIQQVLATTA